MPETADKREICSKCSFSHNKFNVVKDFRQGSRHNGADAENSELEITVDSMQGKQGKTHKKNYLPSSIVIEERGRRISKKSKTAKSSYVATGSSTGNLPQLRERRRNHSLNSLNSPTHLDQRIIASDSMIEELQFKLARLRVTAIMIVSL